MTSILSASDRLLESDLPATGRIFMVTPPNVRVVDGKYEVEEHFVNNLRAYLRNFTHVTFACPVSPQNEGGGILKSIPLDRIEHNDRLSYIRLPFTYREDKHLYNYFSAKKLLQSEISKAQYLTFSPHANYDWPTLAVQLAIRMKRKYAMESDYDGRSVTQQLLKSMPFGIRKIRKTLWGRSFLARLDACFAHSAIALLQGQDVYNAYKHIAPNPQKVLNVQVSNGDYVPSAVLDAKLKDVGSGKPLRVSYVGRMVDMKGPLDWLKAIHGAIAAGTGLQATWFGGGPLSGEMRSEIDRLGLGQKVDLAGILDRAEVIARLWTSDIFLFCHKTGESPRCLTEALAAGCSLVGYGSAFPRDLVADHGGGRFVDTGDWRSLASAIASLDKDRAQLCRLIEAAAASGRTFERDAAMRVRIELIRTYLKPESKLIAAKSGPD